MNTLCEIPENMKITWKLIITFIIACMLLVLCQRWLSALFIALWHLNSAVIFAQLVDNFGLHSTIYMMNVSCPGCNQFDAVYLIEPRQTAYCTYDKSIFLFVIVISRLDNFKQRMAIRRSWGSISAHKGKSIRTFFTCGRTASSAEQVLLENEAEQWHDVLQVC